MPLFHTFVPFFWETSSPSFEVDMHHIHHVFDFFCQVVIQGSDDIASRAIDLLKEIYTNLGPKLQVNQVHTELCPNL